MNILNRRNRFATFIFRLIVGILGLIMISLLLNFLLNGSETDGFKLIRILAGIFICVLFLGYAIGGSVLAEKLLPRFKPKKKN